MTDNRLAGRVRPALSGLVLRSQTDARLVALAATGSQPAFSTIYERYQRELSSHARRIVRADRADDVVQHSMLVAWTALLDGAKISDLRGWLHRIVHNAALDAVKRRGYDDSEIPDSAISPARTDELAERRLDAASALAAIAALPKSQRRALTLTAIEGRSGEDAAAEMGISDGAMRQLVYRARSAVRGAMAALIPLPLLSRLIAAGAPPTATAVALGTAAGGATTAAGGATAAKILAVVAMTATGVGATHALQGHDHPGRTRTSATATLTAPAERSTPAAPLSARARPAGSQHQASAQNGPSQQGSDDHAGQPGTQQHGTSGRSRANGGSGAQQGSQTLRTVPSGQSGATQSPARQDGQSGSGN
ncbi:MAG: sigma-70 family RNA polymerase sigma factor [Solirubrobacteraceae bacterium]